MSVCWGQQTSNRRFDQCLEDSRLVQLWRIGYTRDKTALRLKLLFARVTSSFLCSLWRLIGNKTRRWRQNHSVILQSTSVCVISYWFPDPSPRLCNPVRSIYSFRHTRKMTLFSLDYLQPPFSLKIRPVLISSGAIAMLLFMDWDETRKDGLLTLL